MNMKIEPRGESLRMATGKKCLLQGDKRIARYLGISPRRVKYLRRTYGLPVFQIGRTICALTERLDAWKEERASA